MAVAYFNQTHKWKGEFRNVTTEYGRKLRIDRASRAALGEYNIWWKLKGFKDS
jgi:hypothetical protein